MINHQNKTCDNLPRCDEVDEQLRVGADRARRAVTSSTSAPSADCMPASQQSTVNSTLDSRVRYRTLIDCRQRPQLPCVVIPDG